MRSRTRSGSRSGDEGPVNRKRRIVSDSEGEDGPSKPKKAVISDDEGAGPSEEKNLEGEPEEGNEVVPDVSEDSDDDIGRPSQ